MTKEELVVGHTYEAKKRRQVIRYLFGDIVNDRMILHISDTHVQYDSPAIAIGRHYPKIPIEKFLSWARRDVTSEMPKGEWRKVTP